MDDFSEQDLIQLNKMYACNGKQNVGSRFYLFFLLQADL